MYLPDVQKLEKFFHTKCAEPIRSGLDKRSTHIILLKDHEHSDLLAQHETAKCVGDVIDLLVG